MLFSCHQSCDYKEQVLVVLSRPLKDIFIISSRDNKQKADAASQSSSLTSFSRPFTAPANLKPLSTTFQVFKYFENNFHQIFKVVLKSSKAITPRSFDKP